jgi:hypothetical protein
LAPGVATGRPRRRGFRRAGVVLAVLGLAVLVVWLLEMAGFDRRLAAVAVGIFTTDLFASWLFIARANRGQRRR